MSSPLIRDFQVNFLLISPHLAIGAICHIFYVSPAGWGNGFLGSKFLQVTSYMWTCRDSSLYGTTLRQHVVSSRIVRLSYTCHIFGGSVIIFGFSPKMLRGGGDLWMVLCYSTNTVWMVGTLTGGMDTQTLPAVIKFVWNFCTHKYWVRWIIHLHPRLRHKVKLSLPDFKLARRYFVSWTQRRLFVTSFCDVNAMSSFCVPCVTLGFGEPVIWCTDRFICLPPH